MSSVICTCNYLSEVSIPDVAGTDPPSWHSREVSTDPLDLRVDELLAATAPDGRVLLGIVGPPGAGKSTLAGALVEAADRRHGPGTAAVLPMDGFHLANEVLEALGRRQRKGAPDTFDAAGLASLVERVARRDEPVVYAPRFDRSREEAIAAAIAIEHAVRLLVLEGNYLLCPDGDWSRVGACLDEGWYLDTPAAVCAERLLVRQAATYGNPEAAADWVSRVDQPNAAVVAATRDRADRIVNQ
jgi:pantothenate kinase